jgi:predicted DNA-binding protein
MSRKKIGVTVYFTPEQAESLASLSERTRIPQSVYVREGVDYVLEKNGALPPPSPREYPDPVSGD